MYYYKLYLLSLGERIIQQHYYSDDDRGGGGGTINYSNISGCFIFFLLFATAAATKTKRARTNAI